MSCLECEKIEDAKVPAELRRLCGSQGYMAVVVVAVNKAHGSSFVFNGQTWAEPLSGAHWLNLGT